MLPVTAGGQAGSPDGPGKTGTAGSPRPARAVLAHRRPAVNSARRDGPAVANARASAGFRPKPGGGRLATGSAATAADGRMRLIRPSRVRGTGPVTVMTGGFSARLRDRG